MFGVGEYFVGHAPLTPVLESVQELSVRHFLLSGLYGTARQELRQMGLLQWQTM